MRLSTPGSIGLVQFSLVTLLLGQADLLRSQTPVAGTVTDASGQPLTGVNVYHATTYEGASSDSLGQFAFTSSEAPPFQLHTQYVGFRGDSIAVTASNAGSLTLKLRPTATALAEVVVTAGAFEASDTRKTAVLSSVDVATTGATADLAEALSTLPGSTPAGESGQLLVRGGSAEETQAYINGLRVPQLYTSGLPDVPSRTRFSPFAFSGITFATGGFSAAYGDALSGALLLQTQAVPTEDITSVSLLTVGADVGHTQTLRPGEAIAFNFGGTHLGLYTALNKEATRQITTVPQGLNSQLAYWWTGEDGRNLRTFAQASTQRYAGENAGEAIFYGATDLALANRNLYAQAVYQQPRGRTGLWELGASFAADRDRFTFDSSAKALDRNDLQVRLQYSDNFAERALWRAGLEQNVSRERVEVGTDRLEEVASVSRSYTASFAEADWYLNASWVLRTGLRADYYRDFRSASSDGDLGLSPRLQLSHLFSPDHQLALSVGRYRQRQRADELFGGSRNLAPASLAHVGLTYSKSWDGRVLRAEAYAKRYDNVLTGQAGGYATEGNGYARGLDLFFRDRKTVENADFWVSYSYTDAARLRGTLTERAPVPFAARHNLAVVAKRFFPGPGLGFSATYRYHSGRPYDDPNDASTRFGGTTPRFHDLSVNVTYVTQLRGHFTVIFASFSNVAGARQVHQYRFAQTPDARGEYGRLEVDNVFPRFPFVGVFVNIGDKDRTGTVDDI